MRWGCKNNGGPVLPVAGGIPPLTREQAELFHAQAPDWQLAEATVSLQTKKINGLHENDFIMATKIDRIFARTAAA
jgi:4a-hydroxytetrahydrobiopterin dehydratase